MSLRLKSSHLDTSLKTALSSEGIHSDHWTDSEPVSFVESNADSNATPGNQLFN